MDKQTAQKNNSRKNSAGDRRVPQHDANKSSKGGMGQQLPKEDIKTSIEKQRLANKKKFEDPFFIKIDAMSEDGESLNMKIVKKAKDPNDEESVDYDKDSVSSLEDDQSVNRNKNKIDNKYGGQLKDSNTVIEAHEEDEHSPSISRKVSKTKLKATLEKQKTKMSDISQDEFEKVSVDNFRTMPALVRLDLNLDNLKGYLEDYQQAINEHSQMIQVIQQDLKRKANEKTVASHFLKISEGLHKECGERPHAFRLDEQNSMSDHFQTEDSITLKRNTEKLQEKFEIIGLNIISLQKYKVESLDRIEKMERQLPKCFTIDMFREESQAQESRIMKHITEQLGTFQENQNNHKRELVEGLTFFEKKVNENQQETLWRIKDCEELLKSRISDKYVNDSIKTLDEKLSKNINFNDSKQIERLEKAFKELGHRVVQTNSFMNEKFDDSRKMLMQYDQKLSNVATVDKVLNVQSGYRDMKYNLERELELIQEHVKEVKDKIGELNRRFINLEQATFADMGPGYGSLPQHTTSQQHNQSQQQHQQKQNQQSDSPAQLTLGLHSRNQSTHQQNSDKQSQVTPNQPVYKSPTREGGAQMSQGSSPNVSPMLRKRNQQNNALAIELERKIAIYDDMFQGIETRMDQFKRLLEEKASFNDLKKLTQDKVSKEDIATLMPNEELSQEKMKYMIREEIESVQRAFSDQLKNWDQKMVRLRNDLDIHSFAKSIDKKANEDQVRNDFSNHEFKISTLDRNLIRMASDFEMFQLAINKLHGGLVELQEANRDVLIGKKSVNCLSCSKGGDSNLTMKGKDGKMYRAEAVGAGGNSGMKLLQDDTYIPSAQQFLPDQLGSNQYNSNYQNDNNQMSFIDNFKMKQSHSFYDNSDAQNLPSVTKKSNNSNSYGNFGSKGSTTNIQGQASQSQLNNSLMSKRKLPFGFQVQQEKKELLKVGRGRSGQVLQRQRLDQSGYQQENNTSYDV